MGRPLALNFLGAFYTLLANLKKFMTEGLDGNLGGAVDSDAPLGAAVLDVVVGDDKFGQYGIV